MVLHERSHDSEGGQFIGILVRYADGHLHLASISLPRCLHLQERPLAVRRPSLERKNKETSNSSGLAGKGIQCEHAGGHDQHVNQPTKTTDIEPDLTERWVKRGKPLHFFKLTFRS